MSRKRLILFFDGTWNSPDSGEQPTNVVKLLRAIAKVETEMPQITFYDRGVGTGNFVDRIAGGASGAGLTQNVIDGYRFLGNNYVEGDEIYIFGFSRGAYTARSLAGLIGAAGVLRPRHLGRRLHDVIEVCRETSDIADRRGAVRRMQLDRFDDVRISCVGVWDTVGSLGIPGDLGRQVYLKRLRFHDVMLGPSVDVGLHAVAIDEKRSAFAPTLWVSSNGRPIREDQVVEQVWFPGVHSNVGGSYEDSGLSDIALDWMAKRVEKHTSLVLDRHLLAASCSPDVSARGYESRSALYAASRLYPYQRLIDGNVPAGNGLGDWFRRKFERLDRRNIPPNGLQTINEAVHLAAIERWKCRSVLHDAPKVGGSPLPYRPDTLAAVLAGGTTPVVDWSGEVIGPPSVVYGT